MKTIRSIAVIPAAGLGARFHELGRQYPKCLLPYKGKPLLEATLSQIAKTTPITEVYVGVRPADRAHPMFRHVIEAIKYAHPTVTITMVPVVNGPGRPMGPATTLFCCLEAADVGENTNLLMVLSDSLFTGINFAHYLGTDSISVMHVAPSDQGRFCLAVNDKSNLTTFVDKPVVPREEGMAVSGVYSFRDALRLKNILEEDIARVTDEPQFYSAMSRYVGLKPFTLRKHAATAIVDLGTLQEFLQSRNSCKPRAFNQVEMTETSVWKQSWAQPLKILQEAAWYKAAPEWVTQYLPQVYKVDYREMSYTMERLYGHNLRYLALYYDKSYDTWSKVFRCAQDFIGRCRLTTLGFEQSENNFWSSVVTRVGKRIHGVLPEKDSVTLPLKLRQAVVDAGVDGQMGFFHGDLCFSNIFWSYDSGLLKFVDPRGDLLGHWLYDVAKLAHSVLGRYDYIEEDMFLTREDGYVLVYDRGDTGIRRAFREQILAKLTEPQLELVRVLCASLFASMIPLHLDNPKHCEMFEAEYNRIIQSTTNEFFR